MENLLLESKVLSLPYPLNMQQTLAASVERSGIGLHSGALAHVRILPAPAGSGRYFVRVDLPEQPVIPVRVASVNQTLLSTELAVGDGRIRTVEHLLAALWGTGINNARIEVDGAEIPLLDGSAQGWIEAIAEVGVKQYAVGKEAALPITEPVWIYEGDAFVAAMPSSETRFTYGIDFDYSAIANQWYSLTAADFVQVAPARTFGLAEQIEQLRSQGLIKGGSLENALVCTKEGWLNPPLRFADEPVRHKLLDLIGDLSLLDPLPQAHYLAYKASHKLHVQLAKTLANKIR